MTKILPLIFFPLLASCAQQGLPNTPGNAILSSYRALSRQDSFAYVNTLARDRREVYESIPGALDSLFNHWRGDSVAVTVREVNRHNDTAMVVYDLKVSGRTPKTEDSLIANVYLEGEGWKLGY
ncbi:MAG: hypothetical protein Q8922_10540 [Bacteroidota bacterium]|nr:hypothetical protein [Bacteroidota bacterium]MDP4234560.1 hypothetical protein [Bacteroidota bacterium]MDP4243689.1 hypothetical protein [Bacteroidota bacterium]MDP4288363.1 hypothetical protein [Bacteroidota bacterium]